MNPLFDFTVDKATKTIHITREFAADLDLVWDAFTKPEILDQWTAPKPWRAQTKEMDFREGGRCLTAMISPENVSHWSLAEYIKIQPKTTFTSRNTFCDENGNPLTNGFSITKTSFKPGTETTTVYVEKKFDDLATVEMMVSRGFKEGMAAAMDNLDEYFGALVTTK
jgi:PhnB protein